MEQIYFVQKGDCYDISKDKNLNIILIFKKQKYFLVDNDAEGGANKKPWSDNAMVCEFKVLEA